MAFNLIIDYRADEDIDKAIEYHQSKSNNKALRLFNAIQVAYVILKENPFFENRYAQIHCLPIPNFIICFIFRRNRHLWCFFIDLMLKWTFVVVFNFTL